jgi:hypothetical protein
VGCTELTEHTGAEAETGVDTWCRDGLSQLVAIELHVRPVIAQLEMTPAICRDGMASAMCSYIGIT